MNVHSLTDRIHFVISIPDQLFRTDFLKPHSLRTGFGLVGFRGPWILMILIAVVATASGCDQMSNLIGSGGDEAEFRISHTGLVLAPDAQARLTVRFRASENDSFRDVSPGWRTDDSGVATIDHAGTVRAVAPGSTVIWGELGSDRDSVTVHVRDPSAQSSVRWRSVSVGRYSVCALDTEDQAWCWGSNWWGEVGKGTRRRVTVHVSPTRVAGGHRFAQVAVGANFTCGVTLDSELLCWGIETSIGQGSNDPQPAAEPTMPSTDRRFSAVATGERHACAVEVDGRVYCWGSNLAGQLGVGDFQQGWLTPTPIQSEERFSDVDAQSITSCALAQDGRAWCWGYGAWGDLGRGAEPLGDSPVPEPVDGDHRFRTARTNCGIDVEGRTLCWGGWGAGLDRPEPTTFDPPTSPTPLRTDLGYDSVFTGFTQSCGLRDGDAYCWGSAAEERFASDVPPGDICGSAPCSWEPLPVSGGHRFAQLSLGPLSNCGVTVDGELYCWGSNPNGVLGAGTLEAVPDQPVRVEAPVW